MRVDCLGQELKAMIQDTVQAGVRRESKTRRGNDDVRALYPTAQATNNECCRVHYYKKFKSIRPSEMSNADSPSNSAINYRRREDNSIWNLKTPLGKNEIGKLMKIAALTTPS